jgi:hypothetical protein
MGALGTDGVVSTREDLPAVREAEQRSVLKNRGVTNPAIYFDDLDQEVGDADREEVVLKVLAVMERVKPDVVLAFGPTGLSNHVDDIAMHHAVVAAFARYCASSGREPTLYFWALPPSCRSNVVLEDSVAAHYPQYRDTHAPYLSLTPKEYFQRNCWAAVEGSEPEIEATASLIGTDRMCISIDYPHFDSNFPNVSSNLVNGVSRETAAAILYDGAGLWGFTDEDLAKADAAAAERA